MNEMKILWLASWYPNPVDPFDGDFIQRHARALAKFTPVTVIYVAQLGVDFNVKNDKIIEREEEGVKEKIVFFRYKKTGLHLFDKFLYNLKYYRIYKKIIQQYFIEAEKPDIVHVHVPMKAGIIARWIFKKWNVPYIVSEQSSLYDRTAQGNFFTRKFLHRATTGKIFKDAVAVTNVSDTVGNLLKKTFDLSVVRVIHNTVNTEFFNYQEGSPSRFRFIHVSTLSPQKNVEGMLKVVSRLAKQRQDFEFVLVGPLNENVKEIIDKYGLEGTVICTGEISYPEVAHQMQNASALVFFSHHENFPCVIPEALCCGLPCIAKSNGSSLPSSLKSL
jgi:glycosyltransferase involved in cell wall biosynthesis